MVEEFELRVKPEVAFDQEKLDDFIASEFGGLEKGGYRLLRRSIDARKKDVVVELKIAVSKTGEVPVAVSWTKANLKNVSDEKEVIIVGAGPAGLFAALECIEQGLKPIVLERGKDVQARRRDIAAINKEHVVNPDSNYCFGEGGAGTYSDGKLYTRSKKRGDLQRVLEILVAHGATENILIDAHPHIGTNNLPKIIAEIRESINGCGGSVLFDQRVTDFLKDGKSLTGVKTASGDTFKGPVILATGHSARDIFELLHQSEIKIEAKPFALGVRVEHPQELIDKVQYHCETRGDYLPAAAYSLSHQVYYENSQVGAFSFCMCPGGFMVPSATAEGEVVLNGMSPSRRDSKYANSGIVVSVDESDFKEFSKEGPLSGMAYQKAVEQQACKSAGNSQAAPAQRLLDFINVRDSKDLPESSYQPGLVAVDLREVLPKKIATVLRKGFRQFGKKMEGYLTEEAVLVGVESRTSSPVRIPRDKQTGEHVEIKGLFPCGEGAGFAGGIVSAAMDGASVAQKVKMALVG